jgi:hypothetical protein
MFGRAIEAVDPRVLYGIPALLLLTLTIAVLPRWGWFVAAAAPVLGVGITVAESRRGGSAGLPQVRHVPGE